jgi:hypothetical protein
MEASAVRPQASAVAGVILTLILATSGCDNARCPGGAGAVALSCIPAMKYRGDFYTLSNRPLIKPVRTGRPLHGVMIPGCNDTRVKGCTTAQEPDRPVHAWIIPGVDPSIAFLAPSLSKRRLFINGLRPTNPSELPRAVRRLLR